jgi:hypothetical protein
MQHAVFGLLEEGLRRNQAKPSLCIIFLQQILGKALP